MRTKALARVAGAAMVEMLERKRLCHFPGLSRGRPCSQSPFLIAEFHDVRGCPIRQHHEPKAKIFMDVPAHECIHLVTPRTDGGYVFLG